MKDRSRRPKRTRLVTADRLRDLLGAPSHATVAYTVDGVIHAAPVRACMREDGFMVGLPLDQPAPCPGDAVSLLIDEGVLTSELRGVRYRGTARSAQEQPDSECAWFMFIPDHATAWDYGTMRSSGR